jgi:antitoxin component YwqK of YwqJK toxin-antitoxin module
VLSKPAPHKAANRYKPFMKRLTLILIIVLPTLLFSQTVETFTSDTANIKISIHEPEDTIYIIRNFKDGHWIVYFDQSKKQKALDRIIKNGRPEGTDKYWYRNGQLKEENIWPTQGYELRHLGTEWYSDGKIKKAHRCPTDTCITEYYYHNGQLKYKDIGVSPSIEYVEEYCENGQLKYTPFNPNAREKVFVTHYHCNGKKKYEFNWVAGTYAGDYKEWDENGTLIIKGQYDDDPKKIQSIFNEHWANLEKIGTWQYFDNAGKLLKEELYDSGKIIKTTEK